MAGPTFVVTTSLLVFVILITFSGGLFGAPQQAEADAQTVLLIHADGPDDSTTFIDSSTYAHPIVRGGTAHIDNAQSKFGGTSALFDGTGDYLQLDGSADFAYGTGDFTIDFWMRVPSVTSTANRTVYDGRPASVQGAYPVIILMTDGTLRYYVSGADRIISSVVTANTWIHVAVVRSSGSTKMYFNGVQTGSTYTDSTNYITTTGRPYIGTGRNITAGFSGWLDEFRISKGIARWTTNFTPPTAPYDTAQCADGVDNDSDTKVDYPTDPGCSSISDTDETDPLPGTPGTPTFSNVSYTTMRVNWTAALSASNYTVERCAGAGCVNFAPIATGVTNLYLDESNLSPGTTYRYQIFATNSGGDGPYSGIGTQATNACSSGSEGGNMLGFAWSETIGWISFNSSSDPCTSQTYGMNIDEDGKLSGYAWSENIGWISANSSDLGGCPQSPCTARMEGNALKGWFKALSAEAAESGGWDGWISLSGSSPEYGPTISGGVFSGYAWGSDVVGWIKFSSGTDPSDQEDFEVVTTFTPCLPDPNAQCVDATHWDNICTPTIQENNACDPGYICSAGAVPCVVPGNATGEFWLSPSLVPTGNATQVNWDVIDTVSCRVFSDAGDEWFGGASGSETSSPILETTRFTLECSNSLGEATSTIAIVYATLVPTWVER